MEEDMYYKQKGKSRTEGSRIGIYFIIVCTLILIVGALILH